MRGQAGIGQGWAALLALASPAAAATEPATEAAPGAEAPAENGRVELSVPQMFEFADSRSAAGDHAAAEVLYRALSGNPDIEIRTEARFRLGMMLADRMGRPRDAAVEFRRILDEKPGATRVRLELARMQAVLGNVGAAEREMRAARAAGLPPEVDRLVRFFAGALRSARPFGGDLEVALAPDSNINRATRSDTLGTVIGEFALDDDARARSGIGLRLRGQGYLRGALGRDTSLLLRVSGSGDLYRDGAFSDIAAGVQAGPEFVSGMDRITLSAGPTWRWYGGAPYSFTVGASAGWTRPLGKRAQVRVDAGYGRVDNRRNDLQDADAWSLSASVDRAFSARSGGGLQLSATREAARDPGWSTASGAVNAYLFREFGQTTAVLSLGYLHLEADARLPLFAARRVDDRFTASLAGTFRALRVGALAPVARVRWERNLSTVGIYDFDRVAAELGITAAF